ncbi:TPA: PKD domain-containing protein, partial [Thermoplasmata archaeon]|nr:PKD domain-containing protein [Thermoplasmata archaeon]
KEIRTDGPYKMTIELGVPFAPFVGAITTIPIIPKYYWEPHELGGDPTKWSNALPVGSGPFWYGLDGTPKTGEYPLYRNPNWHHEINRGWQIHVDTLVFRGYTDPNTAWTALKIGDIDCMMYVPPASFNTELPGLGPGIYGFAQSTGFVYEFNCNQMTDELRDELGWSGTNNPILLDWDVRKALAMCIDKETFIEDVVDGQGTYADSLIPDVNPWYHRYDGPELVDFDPAAARAYLIEHGWKYDAAGNDAKADQVPLYGYYGDPATLEPLSFEFLTLKDSPEWEIGANLIVNWTKAAGVELDLKIIMSGQMNSKWYTADYDTWLWDWIFTPMSDPSTDVLSVLTTMEIGSWSDVFMSEPEFDNLYNQSLRAMDVELRKAIVNEMQDFAYEHFSCQCIAYRKELYAVSTERWTGYGDWEDYFMLMPDQAFPYLWMMISPFGNDWDDPPAPNLAPEITSVTQNPEGYVNEAITFSAGATDDSDLVYKWWWGDGTSTDWLSSPGTDHTYTQDGYYTVYFAAKEVGSPDEYSNWTRVTAKVIDISNTAPHSLDFDFSPTNPDTGDVVTFSGTAEDANGDNLNYSWSFGDLYTARGQDVTHQFTTAGTYTVTMYVTDDHVGTEPRPVSTSKLIAVGGNSPPTIDVPDFSDVKTNVPYDFTVTASDPDSDPLTYTWDWDDGSELEKTMVPTATHTYTQQSVFTLEVFADDGTHVNGHNVSDTGTVTVMSEDNVAPVIVKFEASKTDPYTGETITFIGNATDAEGDALKFTFAFGDGTYAVFNNPATDPDTEVSFTTTHAYSSATPMSARLYVHDGQDNTSSSVVSITPVANAEPVVPVLEDRDVLVNTTVTFSTTAYDPDGDDIVITWDFGDGSPMETGDTVTHMYTLPAEDLVYRVYVDDGHSHNVTKAAVINVLSGVNLAPEVDELVNKTALVLEVVEFTATATDPNEDVLTYTWDFGDESDLEVGQTVEHAYDAVGEYTFTVYVDDGEFNESSSATMTVTASEPPVADAGANQTVAVGDDVTFSGAGSTDDVEIVNYTWTFTYDGDPVTLYDVSAEFTFDIAGEYEVTLTVTDAEDQTDTDTMTVTVEEEDGGDEDDEKSFLEAYGLPLGILIALLIVALVLFFVMKGRKGGKSASSVEVEGLSAGEPEEPGPPADEQSPP